MDCRIMFSIIVPCYNVADYVSRTIESVLNQDYQNWELILVNDGSKDTTLVILESYALKDKRIVVCDIPNGGVSKARNYGLAAAHGNWILFLDSDDWFENSALSTINYHITKYPNTDILGFNHYYNFGIKEWKQKPFKPQVLKRNGDNLEWFKLDMMFPHYDAVKNHVSVGAIRGVWGKAFRTSIIKINNLHFDENLKISEDAIFCLEAFEYAREVTLVNEYLIHYRLHSSSTMSNYSPDVMDTNMMALQSYAQHRQSFFNKNDFDICYLGMVSECLFRSFKLYLLHKRCHLPYKDRKQLIRGGG